MVKNTLAQSPTAQSLTNNAALGYAINGVAATPKTAGATINVWQPLLNVSKSAATATGGTVITAGELITYTVKIANSGTAPAYNPVLTDTLPVGLRQAGVTTTGITLVNTATNAVTATLPTLAPAYSSATGVATWNFDVAGSPDRYAIPPGQTLQVVYQVKADNGLGSGMTLNNQALVTTYYSFDSQDVPAGSQVTNRQVYGPTSTATVQLTTAAATALSKQALVTKAAIGQPFTYQHHGSGRAAGHGDVRRAHPGQSELFRYRRGHESCQRPAGVRPGLYAGEYRHCHESGDSGHH